MPRVLTLEAVHRYPVKSCGGEALDEAVVEPWGLAGDRRWLLVDTAGHQLTAREHPRLLQVAARLRADGGLLLSGVPADPGTGPLPDLTVPVPTSDQLVPVVVWRTALEATPAGPGPDAWFAAVLGRPARLVYLDDPTRRRPNPAFAGPDDRVSFADGYPLLVTTPESLARLNEWIADDPGAAEAPVPMSRFRPNVVVAGAEPFAEDGWRRLRIGAAEFRAVKGCDRCVMTMTDASTGRRGKEPIRTLSRHRKWDGVTWFGMNLIPDSPGARLAVGDPVEILDSVPAPDGPPR
jgi:MOSC domain-containing protein